MNPNGAGVISEPFEGPLLAMAKTPIPARDLGRYCDYAGLVSFARSCHPVGLINAGDVDHALEDILEVGQVYQTSNSRGLQWAAVTGVGIAAATRPDATVDSVLGAIFDVCGTFHDRFVQDARRCPRTRAGAQADRGRERLSRPTPTFRRDVCRLRYSLRAQLRQ